VHKALTLEEIARATKIRPRFLAAIESGEYDKLPSAAYAQGFVRNYATFLGLSQKEILALYRREFDEKKHIQVLPDGLAKQGVTLSRLSISRSFVFAAFVFLLLAGYLGLQYRAMFFAPSVTLDSPKEDSRVRNEVIVTGKTDPSVTVYVNETAVSVTSDGEFRKKLSLFSGTNSITVTAKNRYGKETVIRRNVLVSN
jgi:cytoskeletal protein RodZ